MASLRAHDLLVQALRVRIAKLQKQKFGPSSERIEREIEQLELALEDLQGMRRPRPIGISFAGGVLGMLG